MTTEYEMKVKKQKEFLVEYKILVEKYGVFVGGCGCCNSPYIELLEDNTYKTRDEELRGHMENLIDSL